LPSTQCGPGFPDVKTTTFESGVVSASTSAAGSSSGAVSGAVVGAVVASLFFIVCGCAGLIARRRCRQQSARAPGNVIFRAPVPQLRREESSGGADDGAIYRDTRLVDVRHEEEAVALFGRWPEACESCGSALHRLQRIRLTSAYAKNVAFCRPCALDSLRNLNNAEHLFPYDRVNGVVLPDGIAECTEGSQHVPYGGGGLTTAEATRLMQRIELDARVNPNFWYSGKCPSCGDVITVPMTVHQHGGPVVCHACTHRVCTHCNTKFGALLVSGRPNLTHEGRTCAQVEAIRMSGENLTPAMERDLGIKPCPNCGRRIQRYAGCTTMTCGAHAHAGVVQLNGCTSAVATATARARASERASARID
jgi:hypothetical protein